MSKLAINGGEPIRKIPFPKWPVYGESEKKALEEVLQSGVWGIGGSKVREFERKFANYHSAEYGICVVNGTAALEVALRASGIGPGDEVIVPAYTFLATASSILLINAVPIFVDVDPDTYCIDPKEIENAVTEKTKAIIPVHLAGHSADMDKIMEIAKENNLVVIEDCAQAHLAEWRGRKIGSIGDVGCFSFQSSKNMTSGEGGIIVTNDKDLAEKCWSYHNCGRTKGGPWYKHPLLGWNYRMTEFQAAILLAQLNRLERQNKTRNENALYLSAELSEIEGITPLKRDERVTKHAYHLYIFRYAKEKFSGVARDRFLEALNAEGIPCSEGYVPLYKEGYLNEAMKCPLSCSYYSGKIDYTKVDCPVTEKACNEEAVWFTQNILLGTKEDMDTIVEAIQKVKNNVNELIKDKEVDILKEGKNG